MDITSKRFTDPRHYIFYHKQCTDGSASAYAAWKHFGSTAEYIEMSYGEPLPHVSITKDSEIYFLDYSTDINTLIALSKVCKKVQVIDHHLSAYNDFIKQVSKLYSHKTWMSEYCCTKLMHIPMFYNHVCSVLGISPPIFIMDKSAALLAWKYFHPTLPIPDIIKYVSDRDLQLFKYELTRPVLEGVFFSGLKNSFQYWHLLATDASALEDCIAKGKDIIKYRQTIVDTYKQDDRYCILEIDNLKVAIYNTIDFIDEIAESFYSDIDLKVDYTLSYFINNKGCAKLSFRTQNKDTGLLFSLLGISDTVNLIPIAKKWHGGGHPTIAGATLTLEQTITLLKLLNDSKKIYNCVIK